MTAYVENDKGEFDEAGVPVQCPWCGYESFSDEQLAAIDDALAICGNAQFECPVCGGGIDISQGEDQVFVECKSNTPATGRA